MTPASKKGKQPGGEEVPSVVRAAAALGEASATVNTPATGTGGSGATKSAGQDDGGAKEDPPPAAEATDDGDKHEVPKGGNEDDPDLGPDTANNKPVQKRPRSPQPTHPDVDTNNSLEIAMTHEQRIEMIARGEALRHVERAWKAQQRLVRRCMGLRMRSEQWQSAPSADGADGREPADTDPAAGTEAAATVTKSKERKDPAPTTKNLGGHEHRRGPVQRKDKVPKGRGAYTFYQNMVRERFVMENPDLDWSKMTMKIGESWTRLTEEEKRPWKEKAEEENAGGKRESPPRGPRLFPPATEMKKLTGNKK